MSKQIVELPVEHLKLAQYVSRLDRPWTETPFLFYVQGFLIAPALSFTELRAWLESR